MPKKVSDGAQEEACMRLGVVMVVSVNKIEVEGVGLGL